MFASKILVLVKIVHVTFKKVEIFNMTVVGTLLLDLLNVHWFRHPMKNPYFLMLAPSNYVWMIY
jgi:hypothetical protein